MGVSVLSTRTSKNVGLQTLCTCSVRKTRTVTRPRPPIQRSLIASTVKLLLSGHSRELDNRPLNRGHFLTETQLKTTLGMVKFSVYQI